MKRSSNHLAKNELNISVKNKTSLKTIFKINIKSAMTNNHTKIRMVKIMIFFLIFKYNVMFHTDKDNRTILSYLVTTKSTDI